MDDKKTVKTLPSPSPAAATPPTVTPAVPNGVNIDTAGNPIIITFVSGGGTPLPAIVIGPQATGGIAFNLRAKRIQWLSIGAAAGDQVILKDVPANAGTPRTIFHKVATGADYVTGYEDRPRAHENPVGCQVWQFDSGEMLIFY